MKDALHAILGTPNKFDQEANKPNEKALQIQGRLAQNREAARKSRLRKKAYVQRLESSRLKLMQLEQELDHARQQVHYASFFSFGFGLLLPCKIGLVFLFFVFNYSFS
ncbi:hypothetical protein RJT34_08435 [Clitoria ternatea]|uniref:BZIP domain-containing protein n=1 Tax=Clitoria ternatea TaxID=43366 RepID=A0AAN9K5S8_CLITE